MSEQTKPTQDEVVFGKGTIVYCNQHLNPHWTGWCTVDVRNKIALNSLTLIEAEHECRSRGFKLYGDIQ
jgi:hypothetical protein